MGGLRGGRAQVMEQERTMEAIVGSAADALQSFLDSSCFVLLAFRRRGALNLGNPTTKDCKAWGGKRAGGGREGRATAPACGGNDDGQMLNNGKCGLGGLASPG